MLAVEKPVAVDLKQKGKLTAEPMEDMDVDVAGEDEGEDLYTRLKNLQRQLEFYEIQVRWSEA